MISLIEAKNFRCLRYVKQRLERFHVLVGPNGSGKTTFLDVVALLGRLVSDGLDAAIEERTSNFEDLVWGRASGGFELAIEVSIPDEFRSMLRNSECDTVRYEVGLGLDKETGQAIIVGESVLFKKRTSETEGTQTEFPSLRLPPESIITAKGTKGIQRVITKAPGQNDNFYSQVFAEDKEGGLPTFRLGPRRSALANLPEDETRFPVSTWLKQFLAEGVQQFQLNSVLVRRASRPGQARTFKSDGSNLPWVVNTLEKDHPDRLEDWIAHLQEALPDLTSVRTIERGDDKHRYLMLKYGEGLEVPSWMASDGTLRLMALTLPAYLPQMSGVCLIEEPENGIHPKAVETMFQSLSSVYGAQILLASHSPVILNMADADSVLCFGKTPDGATDIVRGDVHPALVDWQGETGLGVLLAAGVLG